MKMWTTLSAGRRDLITVFVGSGLGGGNYSKIAPRKRQRERERVEQLSSSPPQRPFSGAGLLRALTIMESNSNCYGLKKCGLRGTAEQGRNLNRSYADVVVGRLTKRIFCN